MATAATCEALADAIFTNRAGNHTRKWVYIVLSFQNAYCSVRCK